MNCVNRLLFGTRIVVAAACGLLVVATAGVSRASTILEEFNSNPGWTGSGNGSGYNSYGFSETDYAGATAGEAGGAIASRSDGFTWYADDTLGGVFGLSDQLTANGRFTVNSVSGLDGGFEVGFFNVVSPVRVPNDQTGLGGICQGMAMRIIDDSATTVRMTLRFGNDADSENYSVLNVGTDYLFALAYDPVGGGPGAGKLDLSVRLAADNSAFASNVLFGPTAAEWALNAFGISTLDFGANRTDGAAFYMDNVTYSVVPEPTTVVLLASGVLGILAHAWRKRKQLQGVAH